MIIFSANMTEQIVIKLNKNKFKPLLEKFRLSEQCRSDSEVVGKALFANYLILHEKVPKLKNKTRLQFLLEAEDSNMDKQLMELLKKYTEFVKTGKPPC